MEFISMLAAFRAVVDVPGMDSRAKFTELAFWLDGPAATIVASAAQCAGSDPEDIDTAYAKAISELENLFGQNSDAAIPLLREVANGKAIAANDYSAHLQLYADLVRVDATARNIGRKDELHKRDVIAEILTNRVAHLDSDFWTKDDKLYRKENRRANFDDFLQIVLTKLNILKRSRMFVSPPKQAKVAATVAQQQQKQQ